MARFLRECHSCVIDIELEQGSGKACTADSTYFVHASITADGPTTAIMKSVPLPGKFQPDILRVMVTYLHMFLVLCYSIRLIQKQSICAL